MAFSRTKPPRFPLLVAAAVLLAIFILLPCEPTLPSSLSFLNDDFSLNPSNPPPPPPAPPTPTSSKATRPPIRNPEPPPTSSESVTVVRKKREGKRCDLYQGKWVRAEEGRYPLYPPGSCPYLDEVFSCQENGRPDQGYMQWKWQPDNCDLPRFNGTDLLERLRHKRLVLVGDSLNRNQFESMVCLLREALPDKSKIFETPGHEVLRGKDYFVVKLVDYNCTVEYVQSRFLIQKGTHVNRKGDRSPLLMLDRIDDSAKRWANADILIFNTGHWWSHWKLAMRRTYYQVGGVTRAKLDAAEALRRALRTWARWIDGNMNPARNLIFYRSYSTSHFRGGNWNSGGTCKGETDPLMSGAYLDRYPLMMKIVEETIRKMRFPVILSNVTKLTNFRRDGHPSIYRQNLAKGNDVREDCSHWCLPGIPDAWNELLYATLVKEQYPNSLR